MAIDSAILKFWQEQFPILRKFTPSTIFAKTDLFLIGLRLDKVCPTEYRIYLEIHPLWKPNYRIPSIAIELHNKKSVQIFIECKELPNNYKLDQAIECAHDDFDPVLRDTVNLEDLMNLIDVVSYRNHSCINGSDEEGALELKMVLATHYGNRDMINGVMKQVKKLSGKWDKDWFRKVTNMTVEEWKSNIKHIVEDKESLKPQIEEHLKDKRIQKLNYIRILPQQERYNPKIMLKSKMRNDLIRFYYTYVLGY